MGFVAVLSTAKQNEGVSWEKLRELAEPSGAVMLTALLQKAGLWRLWEMHSAKILKGLYFSSEEELNSDILQLLGISSFGL